MQGGETTPLRISTDNRRLTTDNLKLLWLFQPELSTCKFTRAGVECYNAKSLMNNAKAETNVLLRRYFDEAVP